MAPLLALVLVVACSSDSGDIDRGEESVTSTTTTVNGGGGETTSTASTTEPDDTEPVEAAELPGSMWGVEAGSYDLIRLDTDTGDIVQRITGWGGEAGAGDQDGGLQALQQIAAAGDNLWVADCCEPAVGTVFRIDPSATITVPEAEIRVNGTSPVLSPDGTRLAVGVLDIGVAVHDAGNGELLVGPELIGTVINPPGGDAPAFAAPVAWLDGDTLAVAVDDDGTSTVTMVSITESSAPSAVGPIIEVDGSVVGGATRSDGALVLAVKTADGGVMAGQVYATDTGAQDAAFTLDPATTAIDYDASGTFLLVSRENLPPTWQGAGQSGELGPTALVFAGWDDSTD